MAKEREKQGRIQQKKKYGEKTNIYNKRTKKNVEKRKYIVKEQKKYGEKKRRKNREDFKRR